MQELKQGTKLQGGKYVIKRVLGQGGFGITYLAEQVSLKREVAIKEFFMKDSCDRDDTGKVTVPTSGSKVQVERYRAKFRKEAETMAGLDHPNIVSVIDVFEENDTVYYVMPFMAGGSLSDLVKKQGRLSEERALRYVGQVASALKYLHEQRHLCHYDVKPANILLNSYDSAVLIDFGISKNYDSEGNETSSTPVGKSAGFAPLEQYQEMVNEFSPASDVYALGATLYYLVMGKTPPTAISLSQGEELTFDNQVSQGTQRLIKDTMKLASRQRPQDAGIFMGKKAAETAPIPEETIPAKSEKNDPILAKPDNQSTPPKNKSNSDAPQTPRKLNWQITVTELMTLFAIDILIRFSYWVSYIRYGANGYMHGITYSGVTICSLIIGAFSLVILHLVSKDSISKKMVIPELLIFVSFGISLVRFYDLTYCLVLLGVFTLLMTFWDKRTPKKYIVPVLLVGAGLAGVHELTIIGIYHSDFSDFFDFHLWRIIVDLICIIIVAIIAIMCHRRFAKR